jgi:hypothetical protein
VATGQYSGPSECRPKDLLALPKVQPSERTEARYCCTNNSDLKVNVTTAQVRGQEELVHRLLLLSAVADGGGEA